MPTPSRMICIGAVGAILTSYQSVGSADESWIPALPFASLTVAGPRRSPVGLRAQTETRPAVTGRSMGPVRASISAGEGPHLSDTEERVASVNRRPVFA